jgi:hypothetical protein
VAWLPSCEVVVWLSAVAMGALNAANAPAAAMAAEANPAVMVVNFTVFHS